MAGQVFSESWYQIADLQVKVMHSAKIFKQYYRGSCWYVLQDEFNNKFFRLRPEAYEFLMQLDGEAMVGEVWQSYLKSHPDIAPSQDEVVKLLSQLHVSNLLHFKNQAKTEDMLARVEEKKNRELRGKLSAFLFIRIPLWNPEAWLERNKHWGNKVFSRSGLVIWLLALILAVKTVIENFDAVIGQGQGLLSLDNLVFLYISMFGLKVIHELGHAMMTKKFGGSVSTMGVMLLILTPIPYMDASSSWAFRNKYHRVLVGGAGMLVELFIAFLAVMVWANTGDGIIHSLAFNVMFIGSVSSLIFNGNPLLKFDSYYMLSDYLEIPNLYQRARDQWYYWVEKYVYGIDQDIESPSESPREAFWLGSYAFLSVIYRVVVSLSIVMFVSDKWFLLGMVVAAMFFYVWALKPLKQFVSYLLKSPKLQLRRSRAIYSSSAFVLVLVLLFAAMPFFNSIRAPGVVKASVYTKIYSPLEGVVKEVYVTNGQVVKQGDLLLVISDFETRLLLEKKQKQLEQSEMLRLQAVGNNAAQLNALDRKMTQIKKEITTLSERRDAAVVRASHDGTYINHRLKSLRNTWVSYRKELGVVVGNNGFEFTAVASQDDAFELFRARQVEGEVKFVGAAEHTFVLQQLAIIPYEQTTLPSAALGWNAGGEIALKADDQSGLETRESFYELNATFQLDGSADAARLYHGRTGVLKISLPPEPLAFQLYRALKQLVQKRYKV